MAGCTILCKNPSILLSYKCTSLGHYNCPGDFAVVEGIMAYIITVFKLQNNYLKELASYPLRSAYHSLCTVCNLAPCSVESHLHEVQNTKNETLNPHNVKMALHSAEHGLRKVLNEAKLPFLASIQGSVYH